MIILNSPLQKSFWITSFLPQFSPYNLPFFSLDTTQYGVGDYISDPGRPLFRKDLMYESLINTWYFIFILGGYHWLPGHIFK